MRQCRFRWDNVAADGGVKAVGTNCGACADCTACNQLLQEAYRKANGPERGEFGGLSVVLEPAPSHAKRAKRVDPAKTVKPATPVKPVKPAKPAKPAKPVQPAQTAASTARCDVIDLTVEVVDLTLGDSE